jgi:hypothetical protein
MPKSLSLWHRRWVIGGEEAFMLDVVMLVLGVGAFVLFVGYVALCERL